MMNGFAPLLGVLTLAGSVQASFPADAFDGYDVLYKRDDFHVLIDPDEWEKAGNQKPKKGDKVVVNWTGRFENEKIFDSTYYRDSLPFMFQLQEGKVIKCWDEGIFQLSLRMKSRLLCPSDLAYGSEGFGTIVPPNSNIIFDVELLEINPQEPPKQRTQPHVPLLPEAKETFTKSEPLPENFTINGLTTLVGKNWQNIVKDPTLDVLVEYYAPWCGHCKDLAPIWDELANDVESIEDLVIAKFDATLNAVIGLEIQGYPTIKFYPKRNKEGIEYNGAHQLTALHSWLSENSSAYQKLKSAKPSQNVNEEL